ncbi:MAG: FAD:protein FMN transferase [Thiotrichales bacterium]|nr:FAD:protein FMN transferase [Thiotrichales bacterium]
MSAQRTLALSPNPIGYRATFFAMGSDCEVLLQTPDPTLAQTLAMRVANEVWRLQDTYSRYQPNAWLWQLNHAQGQWCELSAETAGLFAFIDQIYQLSEGLFDPTSGILGQVWRFDPHAALPKEEAISALLPFIGWPKVERQGHRVRLPKGMALDLGGLVKEWAADKALSRIAATHENLPVLINLGGDLRVSGPMRQDQPWQVGVRQPETPQATALLALHQGGLATSGDEHRFILHQGKRYGHLLNPFTGWPVDQAPRSVTVAAPTCLLAGVLSSLALLKGEKAASFLQQQQVLYWMIE